MPIFLEGEEAATDKDPKGAYLTFDERIPISLSVPDWEDVENAAQPRTILPANLDGGAVQPRTDSSGCYKSKSKPVNSLCFHRGEETSPQALLSPIMLARAPGKLELRLCGSTPPLSRATRL
ncbi:hypothetical protein GX50_00558 [[Emmonsia] crescens]|uniref:Uncharacterized protein n=1 Tax=[Emmonsia] crescens TaxID=73230 RepID=A0A2B7ZU50_9EURO|nr:hypothetical protein GX50_00558 [Emmonsia crescens]